MVSVVLDNAAFRDNVVGAGLVPARPAPSGTGGLKQKADVLHSFRDPRGRWLNPVVLHLFRDVLNIGHRSQQILPENLLDIRL
jgi:hypothetical protein